ncbi:MAG: hypothetical protein QMB52_03340 [Propionivibrio sp.]
MNPELQKSLQVTALSNSLDSYMLIILLIMIVAGVLGGIANFFLSDRSGDPGRREWSKYVILGVISALTVPLFLNMLSSNLLEAARTRPVDFFVFAGFCLIYVVASRRVVENVVNRLLGQMDQMKREMSQIRQSSQEAAMAAIRDEPVTPREMVQPAAKPEAARESLSYNDVEILRALSEESYVYGNLVGITDKTGLARDLVSARLSVLKSLGLIETRINDKNVLHWYVAPKGKQMLGEILAGQEDR